MKLKQGSAVSAAACRRRSIEGNEILGMGAHVEGMKHPSNDAASHLSPAVKAAHSGQTRKQRRRKKKRVQTGLSSDTDRHHLRLGRTRAQSDTVAKQSRLAVKTAKDMLEQINLRHADDVLKSACLAKPSGHVAPGMFPQFSNGHRSKRFGAAGGGPEDVAVPAVSDGRPASVADGSPSQSRRSRRSSLEGAPALSSPGSVRARTADSSRGGGRSRRGWRANGSRDPSTRNLPSIADAIESGDRTLAQTASRYGLPSFRTRRRRGRRSRVPVL